MHPRAVLALLTSAVVVLVVLVVLAFARPTTVALEDGVQAKNSPHRGLARDGGNTLLPSPQDAAFDHSAYVLVLDQQGRQRVSSPVDKLTSDGLAHDVNVVARLPRTDTARVE